MNSNEEIIEKIIVAVSRRAPDWKYIYMVHVQGVMQPKYQIGIY